MNRGVGLFLIVLVAAGSACSGKSSQRGDSKKGASGRSAPAQVDAAVAPTKAQVRWKTPYAGRLRVLTVAAGVAVVIARRRGDRSSARRIAGFDLKDGRLLWQRTTRVRLFERNAAWTTSHAVVGTILAIAKTADRVEGLDVRTGAKKWQVKATGGVVRMGERFAVAHFDHVRVVSATTGQEIKRMPLGDPRSGAPGNGHMDELRPGTLLQALPGGVLLSRRHGGGLQALHADTLVKRWQWFLPRALSGRPDRFAVGPRTLLVPVRFPRREDETTVSAWPAEGTGASKAFTVTVPGRVSRKRTWVTPTQVVGLSRSTAGQTLLWRVDRQKGTLLDARPFPVPHFCYHTAGVIVCKRRHSVSAHDVATLKRLWRYEPAAGRNIRSVRRAGDLLVMEVGGGLVAKRIKDGGTVVEVVRKLEGHPYRVVAALGHSGGRLVLGVRHLEGQAWGDRLLLLGLETRTGKPVFRQRLGRYPRPGVPGTGPVTEQAPVGRLPLVWAPAAGAKPARVISLFDKVFQILDATSGRSLFARGIPGEAGKPARLLRTVAGVAVYRRGRNAFAVELASHRVVYQASLWRSRFELATPHRAYVSKRRRRGRAIHPVPPRAPDPEGGAKGVADREQCRVRWTTPKRWFCQSDKRLLVIDVASGKVAHRDRLAANVFQQSGLVLTTHARRPRSASRDAWLGLDVITGKVRWRHADADGPKAALPAPLEREQLRPARWTQAGPGLFLVTDAAGRCLRAVEQDTGRARFRACFGALAGPTLSWRGQLLVAARASGPDGKPGTEQVLYVLDPATGKARVLYRPGSQRYLVLGASSTVHDGVLYATVRPAKGADRRNEVIALKLQ